jgi:hypothetical protein
VTVVFDRVVYHVAVKANPFRVQDFAMRFSKVARIQAISEELCAASLASDGHGKLWGNRRVAKQSEHRSSKKCSNVIQERSLARSSIALIEFE